ncbi:MAG: CRISPR-associated ring nuclease Csm6 [Kiritimatiellia bacterium]|jgi:CRISPR-associated protein (TIGR02584 family)
MRSRSKPIASQTEQPEATILFAVVGNSPAVLTETIWALAQARPAVIPDRVVVLTTRVGAGQIRSALFAPSASCEGRPVWEALRAALVENGHDLEGRLRFGDTADDIRVFTATDVRHGCSRELDDIRDVHANNAAADFILEKLRSFTEAPNTKIIASIAGGRKTMGALLYACMSLIGREGDRITHVLVPNPIEDPRLSPRFYFPAQAAQSLQAADGRIYPAKNVRIELADMPFVPLRNRLADTGKMPGTFSCLVRRFRRQLADFNALPAVVRLYAAQNVAIINNVEIKLRIRTMLVLMFLLELNRNPPLPVGQLEAHDIFRAFLERQPGNYPQNWSKSVSVEDLKREISALRKALRQAGVDWMPGLRANSLKLPPFTLRAVRTAKN